jgi:hypothetical protein
MRIQNVNGMNGHCDMHIQTYTNEDPRDCGVQELPWTAIVDKTNNQ